MNDLWKTVLNEIEVEVSKPTFSAFFKNTRLVSVENSVATISAPSYMNAQMVEKRYYALIKNVLDKKLEANISLIFVTHSAIKSNGEEGRENAGPLFTAREIVMNAQRPRPQRVRQDYTFDTFAVSESNRLAYTAALTVAQSPGSKYNPLYLYGTVGVGKTHLMNAIANEIFKKQEDFKALYLTTEEFTNEVVEAIRDKTTTQLRKKFRNVNLLLLDDVQFLTGKERVQEELFHTFNTLVDKGAQVALSSDRPPHEIQRLEARLASRFEGGLTVDVQPPDFELRTAILLIKAKKFNMDLSIEMAKDIAEKVTDARALEGFLLRLSTEMLTGNKPLSRELVLAVLGKKKEKDSVLQPEDIVEVVCIYYNIKATQLKGAKRDAALVLPRHICMFLLKQETRLTLVEIGNLLGGRDHTTVLHAVEKIGKQLGDEGRVKEEVAVIKNKLKSSALQ